MPWGSRGPLCPAGCARLSSASCLTWGTRFSSGFYLFIYLFIYLFHLPPRPTPFSLRLPPAPGGLMQNQALGPGSWLGPRDLGPFPKKSHLPLLMYINIYRYKLSPLGIYIAPHAGSLQRGP